MHRPLALLALSLLAIAPLALQAQESTPTPPPSAFDALMPDYDAARAALASDQLGDLARPSHALQHAVDGIDVQALSAEKAGVHAEQLGAVRELIPRLR